MNARRAVAVIAAACACRTLVGAATMDSIEVARSHDRYRLHASAHLDATVESIYAVLTDYGDNGFSRISGAYKESGFLEPAADGTPIVFTRMEGCLLRHCMTFNRVERLETEKPFHIRSVTLPMQSNFKYATSDWQLTRDGAGGTNLKYELEMEPDFWIPPLIGPWYLKRTLAQGGARAVTRIETLARALDAAPPEASLAAGAR